MTKLEYTIIKGETNIQKMLDVGWKPLGSPSINYLYNYGMKEYARIVEQAMTFKEKTDDQS